MPSDQESLLRPLDTGEDPACLDWSALMMAAGHEAGDTKPDFITFPMQLRAVGKVSSRNEARLGASFARRFFLVASIYLARLAHPRDRARQARDLRVPSHLCIRATSVTCRV